MSVPPILRRARSACALAFVLLMAGCATSTPPAAPLLVTGSATYRERIALPPQAVFEASVEDVSRADAPSTRLGQARVAAPAVPVRFEIAVDPALVRAGGRYVVRARITVDGQLMFTSDTAHPVLDAAGTKHVDILMRRAAASPAEAQAARATLENTYWKLVELRGQAVKTADGERELHFILQGPRRQVAGYSGCNRLGGGYTLDGDKLSFGRSASTMMACAPAAMELEGRFHAMLAATARWRIDGERLALSDTQGTLLARFEAVYLR